MLRGGAQVKLINRKTQKAIRKSVRKAMRKHGAALVAGLVSGVASSLATLANTEAPGAHGKSNLANIAGRVEHALVGNGRKRKARRALKKTHKRNDEFTQHKESALS
jgi:hypothetical protein